MKWFPDRKGMISGLAVAGFGFGATIWVKLAGSWFGGLLNYAEVFGLPPVQSVFVIYGFIFAALVLLGSVPSSLLDASPCDLAIARIPSDFRRP